MSGWQDSNLRPPRPKRGAITGLRYTPSGYSSDRRRIRTFDRLLRRQVLYPAELFDRNIQSFKKNLVGVAGFEPAASTSQTWRDNRATLHPEEFFYGGETEIRTQETVTRLQLSRLLHYHSATSPFIKLF